MKDIAADAARKTSRSKGPLRDGSKVWILQLYVAGQTPKSLEAFSNLRRICEENLAGWQYRIEIIDLLENPQLAQDHQIVALPTLIRKLPPPVRRIIGNLSNTERVLVGLDLKPKGED